MGEPEKTIPPPHQRAGGGSAATAGCPGPGTKGRGVVIPDLRIIAEMTAPHILAAAQNPPAQRPTRLARPEEDEELERRWAAAHFAD